MMKRLLSPSLLATKELPLTHDVGDRILRTRRPPIPEKVDATEKDRRRMEAQEFRRRCSR